MQELDAISSIKPKTLPGIRKLAKAIKQAHSISHAQALHVASRQAGYEDYIHAFRQISDPTSRRTGAIEIPIHKAVSSSWFRSISHYPNL